jgi:hypothetical protein
LSVKVSRKIYLLYKCISFAPTSLVFLQLNEFKLAEWFEDILEVGFSDAEMNITHIESVKWCRVTRARAGLRITCLAVLFGFGKLDDDGNAYKRLAGKLNRSGNRFFASKFDITDTI